MGPVARRPLARAFVVAIAALSALALGSGLASCGKARQDPWVGKTPPPIDSTTGTWVNEQGPLSWKGLVGQVVYLQFGFLR